MDQLINCLQHRHEGLISDSRTNRRSWAWQCAFVIPVLGRQRQESPQGLLISQVNWVSDRRVQCWTLSQKLSEKQSRKMPHIDLVASTHMCAHMQMDPHTHLKKSSFFQMPVSWSGSIFKSVVTIWRSSCAQLPTTPVRIQKFELQRQAEKDSKRGKCRKFLLKKNNPFSVGHMYTCTSMYGCFMLLFTASLFKK